MTTQPIATRPVTQQATPLAVIAQWLGAQSTSTVPVTGISLSTDRLLPGDLYAALPGTRTHGANFASRALEAGAVGVLTDAEGARVLSYAGVEVPVVVVPEPRQVLGLIADRLYGHPARALTLIGVTGTQGKTTTTRLLEGGLAGSGTASAVIGTVGTRIKGCEVKTSLTTPEAPDLHALFAVMVESGVQACAMEVSSHALVLGRVDQVKFDVACFLNLGRDHLDFHRDVDEYFAAKATLFTPERAVRALVNIDDEHGRMLADRALIPTATFGVETEGDWHARDLRLDPSGTDFVVVGPGVEFTARVPMAGGFNVLNALCAIAAAGEAGFDPQAVATAISHTHGVPGRLESVHAGQAWSAIVDYAHKPDAVQAALQALRPVTEGKLIVVLGAGGDRDHGKRPLMAAIAAANADVVIITDDNPRTEDPATIRAELLAGVPSDTRAQVVEIGDRREAIAHAVSLAQGSDTVLVAGKGHESGQEINGVLHPFDDRIVLGEEIGKRL